MSFLETLSDRFHEKISPEPNSGCWIWTGAVNWAGYGQINVGGTISRTGKRRRIHDAAHRVAYTLYKGEIPEGLHIDHLCRTRCCVNPSHLEAVSQKENILRGASTAAVNAVKTHCKHGHAFDEENTYRYHGRRQCKTCNIERQRRYRAAA